MKNNNYFLKNNFLFKTKALRAVNSKKAHCRLAPTVDESRHSYFLNSPSREMQKSGYKKLKKKISNIVSLSRPSTKVDIFAQTNLEKDISQIYWNYCFDKGRIKTFVFWFLKNHGEKRTVELLEQLKNIGFDYATKAGISLGIDDLKIPPAKNNLIIQAEQFTHETINQYARGNITGIERFQKLIDTWHRTSEILKQEVVTNFELTDILNPVYMMAFSGARGNISQVRQLVGMRGLMADPQGKILDFPIRSNFREGLTLTEYIISSYGARKGIVDTALRTANAGYLTRRLVDVAQHVVISHFDCGTQRGVFVNEMKEGNKIIYSLPNRLMGRVLAKDIFSGDIQIASRNQEISSDIAVKISKVTPKVFIRSPLTCETRKLICQLCYGWSLSQGKLVSIGEAVGIIAAQSIGEPGTQLTMRTFHTGGVFTGDITEQINAPYDGIVQYITPIPGTLIRTPQGIIAFLTKTEGALIIKKNKRDSGFFDNVSGRGLDKSKNEFKELTNQVYKIQPYTILYIRNGENVLKEQIIAQSSTITQQKKQRNDAEQKIQSELEGEIYTGHLDLIETTNDFDDTSFEAWDWGYLWILSGKIYQLPVSSKLFPNPKDIINNNSIINQIQWVSSNECSLEIKSILPLINSRPSNGNKRFSGNKKIYTPQIFSPSRIRNSTELVNVNSFYPPFLRVATNAKLLSKNKALRSVWGRGSNVDGTSLSELADKDFNQANYKSIPLNRDVDFRRRSVFPFPRNKKTDIVYGFKNNSLSEKQDQRTVPLNRDKLNKKKEEKTNLISPMSANALFLLQSTSRFKGKRSCVNLLVPRFKKKYKKNRRTSLSASADSDVPFFFDTLPETARSALYLDQTKRSGKNMFDISNLSSPLPERKKICPSRIRDQRGAPLFIYSFSLYQIYFLRALTLFLMCPESKKASLQFLCLGKGDVDGTSRSVPLPESEAKTDEPQRKDKQAKKISVFCFYPFLIKKDNAVRKRIVYSFAKNKDHRTLKDFGFFLNNFKNKKEFSSEQINNFEFLPKLNKKISIFPLNHITQLDLPNFYSLLNFSIIPIFYFFRFFTFTKNVDFREGFTHTREALADIVIRDSKHKILSTLLFNLKGYKKSNAAVAAKNCQKFAMFDQTFASNPLGKGHQKYLGKGENKLTYSTTPKKLDIRTQVLRTVSKKKKANGLGVPPVEHQKDSTLVNKKEIIFAQKVNTIEHVNIFNLKYNLSKQLSLLINLKKKYKICIRNTVFSKAKNVENLIFDSYKSRKKETKDVKKTKFLKNKPFVGSRRIISGRGEVDILSGRGNLQIYLIYKILNFYESKINQTFAIAGISPSRETKKDKRFSEMSTVVDGRREPTYFRSYFPLSRDTFGAPSREGCVQKSGNPMNQKSPSQITKSKLLKSKSNLQEWINSRQHLLIKNKLENGGTPQFSNLNMPACNESKLADNYFKILYTYAKNCYINYITTLIFVYNFVENRKCSTGGTPIVLRKTKFYEISKFPGNPANLIFEKNNFCWTEFFSLQLSKQKGSLISDASLITKFFIKRKKFSYGNNFVFNSGAAATGLDTNITLPERSAKPVRVPRPANKAFADKNVDSVTFDKFHFLSREGESVPFPNKCREATTVTCRGHQTFEAAPRRLVQRVNQKYLGKGENMNKKHNLTCLKKLVYSMKKKNVSYSNKLESNDIYRVTASNNIPRLAGSKMSSVSSKPLYSNNLIIKKPILFLKIEQIRYKKIGYFFASKRCSAKTNLEISPLQDSNFFSEAKKSETFSGFSSKKILAENFLPLVKINVFKSKCIYIYKKKLHMRNFFDFNQGLYWRFLLSRQLVLICFSGRGLLVQRGMSRSNHGLFISGRGKTNTSQSKQVSNLLDFMRNPVTKLLVSFNIPDQNKIFNSAFSGLPFWRSTGVLTLPTFPIKSKKFSEMSTEICIIKGRREPTYFRAKQKLVYKKKNNFDIINKQNYFWKNQHSVVEKDKEKDYFFINVSLNNKNYLKNSPDFFKNTYNWNASPNYVMQWFPFKYQTKIGGLCNIEYIQNPEINMQLLNLKPFVKIYKKMTNFSSKLEQYFQFFNSSAVFNFKNKIKIREDKIFPSFKIKSIIYNKKQLRWKNSHLFSPYDPQMHEYFYSSSYKNQKFKNSNVLTRSTLMLNTTMSALADIRRKSTLRPLQKKTKISNIFNKNIQIIRLASRFASFFTKNHSRLKVTPMVIKHNEHHSGRGDVVDGTSRLVFPEGDMLKTPVERSIFKNFSFLPLPESKNVGQIEKNLKIKNNQKIVKRNISDGTKQLSKLILSTAGHGRFPFPKAKLSGLLTQNSSHSAKTRKKVLTSKQLTSKKRAKKILLEENHYVYKNLKNEKKQTNLCFVLAPQQTQQIREANKFQTFASNPMNQKYLGKGENMKLPLSSTNQKSFLGLPFYGRVFWLPQELLTIKTKENSSLGYLLKPEDKKKITKDVSTQTGSSDSQSPSRDKSGKIKKENLNVDSFSNYLRKNFNLVSLKLKSLQKILIKQNYIPLISTIKSNTNNKKSNDMSVPLPESFAFGKGNRPSTKVDKMYNSTIHWICKNKPLFYMTNRQGIKQPFYSKLEGLVYIKHNVDCCRRSARADIGSNYDYNMKESFVPYSQSIQKKLEFIESNFCLQKSAQKAKAVNRINQLDKLSHEKNFITLLVQRLKNLKMNFLTYNQLEKKKKQNSQLSSKRSINFLKKLYSTKLKIWRKKQLNINKLKIKFKKLLFINLFMQKIKPTKLPNTYYKKSSKKIYSIKHMFLFDLKSVLTSSVFDSLSGRGTDRDVPSTRYSGAYNPMNQKSPSQITKNTPVLRPEITKFLNRNFTNIQHNAWCDNNIIKINLLEPKFYRLNSLAKMSNFSQSFRFKGITLILLKFFYKKVLRLEKELLERLPPSQISNEMNTMLLCQIKSPGAPAKGKDKKTLRAVSGRGSNVDGTSRSVPLPENKKTDEVYSHQSFNFKKTVEHFKMQKLDRSTDVWEGESVPFPFYKKTFDDLFFIKKNKLANDFNATVDNNQNFFHLPDNLKKINYLYQLNTLTKIYLYKEINHLLNPISSAIVYNYLKKNSFNNLYPSFLDLKLNPKPDVKTIVDFREGFTPNREALADKDKNNISFSTFQILILFRFFQKSLKIKIFNFLKKKWKTLKNDFLNLYSSKLKIDTTASNVKPDWQHPGMGVPPNVAKQPPSTKVDKFQKSVFVDGTSRSVYSEAFGKGNRRKHEQIVDSLYPFLINKALRAVSGRGRKDKNKIFLNKHIVSNNSIRFDDKKKKTFAENWQLNDNNSTINSFYNEKKDKHKKNYKLIEKNSCSTKYLIQIKQGWIYKTNNIDKILKYHKTFVPIGKNFVDDILFDKHWVYIECLPIGSSKIGKMATNFLKLKNRFLINIEPEHLHNRIVLHPPSRDVAKQPPSTKVDLYNKASKQSINVFPSKIKRQQSLLKKTLWIVNNNIKYKPIIMSPSFAGLHYNNKTAIKIKTNKFSYDFKKPAEPDLENKTKKLFFNKQSNTYLILIRKVSECSIINKYEHKKQLYQIQNKPNVLPLPENQKGTSRWLLRDISLFSKTLRKNYHTSVLNKQFITKKVISKFPNADMQLNYATSFSLNNTFCSGFFSNSKKQKSEFSEKISSTGRSTGRGKPTLPNENKQKIKSSQVKISNYVRESRFSSNRLFIKNNIKFSDVNSTFIKKFFLYNVFQRKNFYSFKSNNLLPFLVSFSTSSDFDVPFKIPLIRLNYVNNINFNHLQLNNSKYFCYIISLLLSGRGNVELIRTYKKEKLETNNGDRNIKKQSTRIKKSQYIFPLTENVGSLRPSTKVDIDKNRNVNSSCFGPLNSIEPFTNQTRKFSDLTKKTPVPPITKWNRNNLLLFIESLPFLFSLPCFEFSLVQLFSYLTNQKLFAKQVLENNLNSSTNAKQPKHFLYKSIEKKRSTSQTFASNPMNQKYLGKGEKTLPETSVYFPFSNTSRNSQTNVLPLPENQKGTSRSTRADIERSTGVLTPENFFEFNCWHAPAWHAGAPATYLSRLKSQTDKKFIMQRSVGTINCSKIQGTFPLLKNHFILNNQNKILNNSCFSYTSFMSPLNGEVLTSKSSYWTSISQKNRHFILTNADLFSFSLPLSYKKIRQLSNTNWKSINQEDLSGRGKFQNKHFHEYISKKMIKQKGVSSDSLEVVPGDKELTPEISIKHKKKMYKISGLRIELPEQKNNLCLGEFCLYGDSFKIDNTKFHIIPQAGQIIHTNRSKITLRRGQPIFVSPKGILHASNGDFIKKNISVVTLPYQTLKTGDIVQGIPKIEQYFEARTTKRGRLFRDNLPNLLKGLFQRYRSILPWDKAVRQSFYKIQQILVDGVQRVYRSQGVSIADKHIEVIVKQMTTKVKITHGGQTGFFPGELIDLEFVEHVNKFLMKKIRYEPVILGITKASLEVESFLSAASFQQTTRMLSRAAIYKRKDFLKGLKENVIVGNLIPAGTGYLVTLDDIPKRSNISKNKKSIF